MEQAYTIIADLHTHTLASTHAYSSLTEMVRAASERGLYAIAITDHGKAMPGSPRDWYFGNLRGHQEGFGYLMEQAYTIIADLHTHTLASTHAYSSLTEMVRAASERGLYAIAITDHGKAMPGSPRDWYFGNLREVPLRYRGVLTLAGMEANVLDFEGRLDLEPGDARALDWVVASIHHLPLEGLQNPDVEKCTHLWSQVAKDPRVHVIGHSGDPQFAYDVDKVIPLFGEHHKLVEINNHSFQVRPDNIPNCRKIALACKRYGVPIVVDSDAHFETEVGCFDQALAMLEEIDFPQELILNASEQRLNDYLARYTSTFEARS